MRRSIATQSGVFLFADTQDGYGMVPRFQTHEDFSSNVTALPPPVDSGVADQVSQADADTAAINPSRSAIVFASDLAGGGRSWMLFNDTTGGISSLADGPVQFPGQGTAAPIRITSLSEKSSWLGDAAACVVATVEFASNGTEIGTVVLCHDAQRPVGSRTFVVDGSSNSLSSRPVAAVNGSVGCIYATSDAAHGHEPHCFDIEDHQPTARMLADVNPGPQGSHASFTHARRALESCGGWVCDYFAVGEQWRVGCVRYGDGAVQLSNSEFQLELNDYNPFCVSPTEEKYMYTTHRKSVPQVMHLGSGSESSLQVRTSGGQLIQESSISNGLIRAKDPVSRIVIGYYIYSGQSCNYIWDASASLEASCYRSPPTSLMSQLVPVSATKIIAFDRSGLNFNPVIVERSATGAALHTTRLTTPDVGEFFNEVVHLPGSGKGGETALILLFTSGSETKMWFWDGGSDSAIERLDVDTPLGEGASHVIAASLSAKSGPGSIVLPLSSSTGTVGLGQVRLPDFSNSSSSSSSDGSTSGVSIHIKTASEATQTVISWQDTTWHEVEATGLMCAINLGMQQLAGPFACYNRSSALPMDIDSLPLHPNETSRPAYEYNSRTSGLAEKAVHVLNGGIVFHDYDEVVLRYFDGSYRPRATDLSVSIRSDRPFAAVGGRRLFMQTQSVRTDGIGREPYEFNLDTGVMRLDEIQEGWRPSQPRVIGVMRKRHVIFDAIWNDHYYLYSWDLSVPSAPVRRLLDDEFGIGPAAVNSWDQGGLNELIFSDTVMRRWRLGEPTNFFHLEETAAGEVRIQRRSNFTSELDAPLTADHLCSRAQESVFAVRNGSSMLVRVVDGGFRTKSTVQVPWPEKVSHIESVQELHTGRGSLEILVVLSSVNDRKAERYVHQMVLDPYTGNVTSYRSYHTDGPSASVLSNGWICWSEEEVSSGAIPVCDVWTGPVKGIVGFNDIDQRPPRDRKVHSIVGSQVSSHSLMAVVFWPGMGLTPVHMSLELPLSFSFSDQRYVVLEDDPTGAAPFRGFQLSVGHGVRHCFVRLLDGQAGTDEFISLGAPESLLSISENGTIAEAESLTEGTLHAELQHLRVRSMGRPEAGNRTLEIQLILANGRQQSATATVFVAAADDPPVVVLRRGDTIAHHAEDGGPTLVFPNASVTDEEGDHVRLMVEIADRQSGDGLVLLPARGSGQGDRLSEFLEVGGRNYTATENATSFLRRVAFVAGESAPASRTLTVLVWSAAQPSAAPVVHSITVQIVPRNDAPIVSGPTSAVQYTEQQASPAELFDGMAVADPDDTMISAQVLLRSAFAGDSLVLSNGASVSGSSPSTDPVLSSDGLSADIQLENIDEVLRQLALVGFRGATDGTLPAGVRSVTVTITDNGSAGQTPSNALSANYSRQIEVQLLPSPSPSPSPANEPGAPSSPSPSPSSSPLLPPATAPLLNDTGSKVCQAPSTQLLASDLAVEIQLQVVGVTLDNVSCSGMQLLAGNITDGTGVLPEDAATWASEAATNPAADRRVLHTLEARRLQGASNLGDGNPTVDVYVQVPADSPEAAARVRSAASAALQRPEILAQVVAPEARDSAVVQVPTGSEGVRIASRSAAGGGDTDTGGESSDVEGATIAIIVLCVVVVAGIGVVAACYCRRPRRAGRPAGGQGKQASSSGSAEDRRGSTGRQGRAADGDVDYAQVQTGSNPAEQV